MTRNTEPGVPGRGAIGKVQFAAAVELDAPRGFGRARLAVIEDASATSLRTFLVDNVHRGARVITASWSAYLAATRELYEHEPTSVSASGQPAHEVLPAVHTVVLAGQALGDGHAAGLGQPRALAPSPTALRWRPPTSSESAFRRN